MKPITVGTRVQLSPSCDLWMRGAKYGEVVAIRGEVFVVKMDHPQVKKLQRFRRPLLTVVSAPMSSPDVQESP